MNDYPLITVKNWDKFQHYKHRNPTWIKLHKTLLDDYEFSSLPLESVGLLTKIWMLASEENGHFFYNLKMLAFRLRMTKGEIEHAVKPLLEKRFLLCDDEIIFDSDEIDPKKISSNSLESKENSEDPEAKGCKMLATRYQPASNSLDPENEFVSICSRTIVQNLNRELFDYKIDPKKISSNSLESKENSEDPETKGCKMLATRYQPASNSLAQRREDKKKKNIKKKKSWGFRMNISVQKLNISNVFQLSSYLTQNVFA